MSTFSKKLFGFAAVVFGILVSTIAVAHTDGIYNPKANSIGDTQGIDSNSSGTVVTPFSITNTANVDDATSQTTYTFNAAAIGTAGSTRMVQVDVASRAVGTVGASSGLTIGGVSATLIQTNSNGADTNTTITDSYALAVPAGTTATIVVTFPSAMLRCGISVNSIVGSNKVIPSAGAITTAQGNGNATTAGTVTVPIGGGSVIAGASVGGTPPSSSTNFNISAGSERAIGGSTLEMLSGTDTAHSGSTTYTITWGGSPAGPENINVDAWHP